MHENEVLLGAVPPLIYRHCGISINAAVEISRAALTERNLQNPGIV